MPLQPLSETVHLANGAAVRQSIPMRPATVKQLVTFEYQVRCVLSLKIKVSQKMEYPEARYDFELQSKT